MTPVALTRKRQHKYNAKATVIDGIRFASKREAAYYCELKLREKAGEVHSVELQKRFALTNDKGALISTYVADFDFYDNILGRHRTVDVKGVETEAFRLKKRMMRVLKGIDVEVVK